MVELTNKQGTATDRVNIKWMPTWSWIQGLCLTPCYADHVLSFTEQANDDWKLFVLDAAQRSCVRCRLFCPMLRQFS